jgi:hypothetical protein
VARYRVMMSIGIEARDDREAREHALKLEKLLKESYVRMAVVSSGIPLTQGDGQPVVHQPQRERA